MKDKSIILITIVFSALYILYVCNIYTYELNHPLSYKDSCSNECTNLNLTFFKVDTVITYAHDSYFCYCLSKDNLPVNIGLTEGVRK